MSTLSVADATRSYDCKTPGCRGEAKTNRGPYTLLCAECIRTSGQRERAVDAAKAGHRTRLAAPSRDLYLAAKRVDVARGRQAKHDAALAAAIRKLQAAHRKKAEALAAAVATAERDYRLAAAALGLAPTEGGAS